MQNNLDEQDQIDEIIGKIKSAIAKHKDKKHFKKNASKLAKQHDDHASSHDKQRNRHKDSAVDHQHNPKKQGTNTIIDHTKNIIQITYIILFVIVISFLFIFYYLTLYL